MITTGQKIERWRGGQGWTQETLAKKVGVDQTTVSDWESGKYAPNPEHLRKLGELGIL